MQGDDYKVRDVERLLAFELENWIRYGRKRDWMPQSFRCPLGFLYKPVLGDVYELSAPIIQVDELEALAFEKVVLSLPVRLRQAFVMHHLDRAHAYGHIVIIKGRFVKAQLLGVGVRQYHALLREAHELVLHRWRGVVGGEE